MVTHLQRGDCVAGVELGKAYRAFVIDEGFALSDDVKTASAWRYIWQHA